MQKYTFTEGASVLDTRRNDEAKKRVLVIDDHPIVREGIQMLLAQTNDLCVCGEAGDAATAMRLAATTSPQLAVVDIALGRDSGLDVIRSLRQESADLPVLALSMHDERLFAERALKLGANGYIMKQEGTTQLLGAMRQVLAGQIYVSSRVSSSLLKSWARQPSREGAAGRIDRLTDRELDVLRLLGEGLGTRQIARQLHVSIKTIEAHRANIKDKLGIDTATELVVYAARWQDHGETLSK